MHFGTKINYKKCLILENVLRAILGDPRHPGRLKKLVIGGLFKIEGRPFRVGVLTGMVLEAKIAPKWTSESVKLR